jgi:signal transduction histidine kinase
MGLPALIYACGAVGAIALLSLGTVIAVQRRRTRELRLQWAERRLADEHAQALIGRLIAAQDEERARIARELHDDVSQQLAFLRISIERFRQGAQGLSADDRRQINAIVDTASRCASDIHQLSHRLHPSTLDFLSLVDTVAGLCRDARAGRGATVQFVHRDVPERVDRAIKVCIVRIVQEGLRNVLAHSRVTDATVELSGRDEGIELCISDAGCGFDPAASRHTSGLGLVSMRERLRPLGGRLDIESAPGQGTRLRVSLPLGPGGEACEGAAAAAAKDGSAAWMIRS